MIHSNDTNKLIVIGLSKEINDDTFKEMFKKYGEITHSKVVYDTETKISKGYGFITFTSSKDKKEAIKELNNKIINNRTLHVREIIPKELRNKIKNNTISSNKNNTKSICWAFQKGKCKKGTNCLYSHEAQDGGYGNCFEYIQNGICKKGNKCIFYHPIKETQYDSDTEINNNNNDIETTNIESNKKKKTKICYAFQKKKCHRGKKCTFLHQMISLNNKENVINSKANVMTNKENVKNIKRQIETNTEKKIHVKRQKTSDKLNHLKEIPINLDKKDDCIKNEEKNSLHSKTKVIKTDLLPAKNIKSKRLNENDHLSLKKKLSRKNVTGTSFNKFNKTNKSTKDINDENKNNKNAPMNKNNRLDIRKEKKKAKKDALIRLRNQTEIEIIH